MRLATVPVALVALVALVAVADLADPDPAFAGQAGAATTPVSAFVVRSGHVPYESCPSSNVTLTVSVPRHAFVPGQLVRYVVALRNTSSHACTAPGAPLVAGPLPLVLGPCSPVSVRITGAHGRDVYPGEGALSCPAILGASIAPHRTVTATGTWNQRSAGAAGIQQPPGTYTLTVGGTARVPVRLALGPQTVPVPVPVPVSPPAPSQPLSPSPTPAPALTRSAHIAYEGCPAGQVILSVTVAARPVPWLLPLSYTVRLHNTGRTACGPPAGLIVGASRHLTVGPCGALSAVVSDRKGVDVYPGSTAFYMCPQISPVHLGPGATETASGTWFKYELLPTTGGSPRYRKAPPGSYRLTVSARGASAARVSVPFSIAAPAGAYPVPGPTPTIVPG